MNADTILTARRGSLQMGDVDDAFDGVRIGRFDLVIFCAQELEPPLSTLYTNVRECPLDDAVLTREEALRATAAAQDAARAFLAGREVLVNCAKGRNRSGIVVALAVHMVTGCGGATATQVVRVLRQRAEGPALVNPSFVRFLERIPPGKAIR